MRMQPWRAPREPHHVPPPPHHVPPPPPPPPPHHYGAPVPPHVAIMEGLEIVSQQLADLSQQLSELKTIAGVHEAETGDTVSE